MAGVENASSQAACLSFTQERLWLLDRLGAGTAYNVPFGFHIRGALDKRALERAIREIVRRHEVLRTVFVTKGGEPRQHVVAEMNADFLSVTDLGRLPQETQSKARRDEMEAVVLHRFDLERGPLLLVRLVDLSPDEHDLLVNMHHIVTDGWSVAVFCEELRLLYEAFSAGRPSPLAELPIQYADFSLWQRRWLQGPRVQQQLAYWRRQLSGAPALLELPTDLPRPSVPSYAGDVAYLELDEELVRRLRELCREHGVTLFMLMLAAFQALLFRYTGQDDIVVGSPIANRTRTETEGLIGAFINMLALRARFAEGQTFKDLLAQTKEIALNAYANQEVPFERLVREVRPERTASHHPIVQVVFGWRQPLDRQLRIGSTAVRALPLNSRGAQFDLSVFVIEAHGRLVLEAEYATDMLHSGTVERMLRHYVRLLEGVLANPANRVSAIPLLTREEERNVLVEWAGAAGEFPAGLCIHELVEAQAEETPDAVALAFAEGENTYRALNQSANRLAHRLRGLGVRAGTVVGLYSERSVEAIVGMLAVLKSGAAYVPLDTEAPEARLAFILEDTRAPVILFQEHLGPRLGFYTGTLVAIDSGSRPADELSARNLGRMAGPSDLAYVMYTSGSTGKPKGVMVEHRGVVNHLVAMRQVLDAGPESRFLQKTPMTFDVAVSEVLVPLICGGRLVITPPGSHRDPEYLRRTMEKHRITHVHFVPSMLASFLGHPGVTALAAGSKVICIGEVLPRSLEKAFFQHSPQAVLFNMYGPTEASVVVTSWQCSAQSTLHCVPIGRPMANVRLRILDRWRRPVPVGVVGELYIGGVCLARGYLNRPELTAEKFVADPFRNDAADRLYCSGDLCKYLPDGSIEFIGRADGQVKIRGHRIELSEVEHVLREQPGVLDAAVVLRRRSTGDAFLAAFVQCPADEFDQRRLRDGLRSRLPEYMVPAFLLRADTFPVTSSGKVDRKALAGVALTPAASARGGLPGSPEEDLLVWIWAEAMELSFVGVDDDFFELGGDSLLAVRIVSRLREIYGRDVPFNILMEAPTVRALAEKLGKHSSVEGGDAHEPILPAPRPQDVPLSCSQERLWFLYKLGMGEAYNVPFGFRLNGPLDKLALQRALNEVVRRHEILRTVFVPKRGLPTQVVVDDAAADFTVVSLERLPKAVQSEARQREAGSVALHCFDLERSPPLLVRLVELSPDEHDLLVNMHHIVTDGWSVAVFCEELRLLYEAFSAGRPSPLAELPIQYADFSLWQRRWLQGPRVQQHLAYWRRQLSGAPALLELPTDLPRPSVPSYAGDVAYLELDEELVRRLRELCREHGVTLFMLMLAAFQALLFRYTGQDDIVVGSPIANRTRTETEHLIGAFINTLVLRARFAEGQTFKDLLAQTKETALGAYAHQDIPFERLLEEIRPERVAGHHPMVQVMFVLQNVFRKEPLQLPGLAVEPIDLVATGAKLDLTLSVTPSAAGLRASLEYRVDLFDRASIEGLLKGYRQVLEEIIAEPGGPIRGDYARPARVTAVK